MDTFPLVMVAVDTILLAEDDPNQALLFCHALASAGFTNPVQVVGDGERALAYLAGKGKYEDRLAHPLPVLLLLDLKMPRLDGIDVLHWVRRQKSPMKELPVIVLTTSSYGPDITRAYQAGANSFLVKPVGLTECVTQMKGLGDFWLKHCALPSGNNQPNA